MMKIFSAAALAAMIAAPAFAQSGGSGNQGIAAPGNQAMGASQQKVRQQLEQAGFRNVQVIDAAYLVRAETQDGSTVWMTVDAPSRSGSTGGTMGGSSSGKTDMTSPRPPYGSPDNRVGNQGTSVPPSALPDNRVPYERK